MIKVHDKYFRLYLSERDINSAIERVAEQINKDFAKASDPPIFLAILNGSFMFAADLMKAVDVDCIISFIKVKSYAGTQSTGEVNTLMGLEIDIRNRTVILLEDIVDTGNTVKKILEMLPEYQPKAIKIATLLQKPTALQHKITCDYVGIEIPDKFVVGYGLDYDDLGRNYKAIYQLVENPEALQNNT